MRDGVCGVPRVEEDEENKKDVDSKTIGVKKKKKRKTSDRWNQVGDSGP